MVAMGPHVEFGHVVTAEKEPHLSFFVNSIWPCEPYRLAQDIKLETFVSRIRETNFDVLLLAGGPPCQPFSGLAAAPGGFDDLRSDALLAFEAFKKGLAERVPLSAGQSFCWLLEEVVSMKVSHREQISEILGSKPALANAADWGVGAPGAPVLGLGSRVH